MSNIKKVGVVGCGLMGSGIAQVCAEAGYDVVVREVDEGALKKGLGKIDSFLAKGVEKGKVKPERKAEVMGRLTGTTDLKDLAGCDFVIEVNEAFAAQYLAVEKDLGLDRNKVNVNGGAIALGHPLGMTGARLVLTLLLELRRRGARRGLATACIGGGQGIAAIVETV